MRYIYTILLFLFLSVFSVAQEMKVISDLRFIGELGIQKSIFNNWRVGAATTLKLEKNISRTDELDFDLNAEYSPYKFIAMGVGYRIAFNQKRDNTFEKKYRFFGELELKQGIKRFKLAYRVRYQNIDDDFFQYEQYQPSKNILRNRIRVSYNIRKSPVEPFVYAELYGLLKINEDFATKIKYALGVKYNLKKYGKIKAYYRIDKELNSFYPCTFYSIGMGYSYDF